MEIIYFDNAATTKPCAAAVERINEMWREDYGNPSSATKMGLSAERQIKRAAGEVARALSADAEEIYFTSGGTEANNLAILGAAEANARAGRHILTTQTEHPSVLEAARHLQQKGFTVEFVPVDGEGRLDLAALVEMVRPDTVLLSVIHVHNEWGTVQELCAVGEALRRKNPRALFHADGVQAFGKQEINVKKAGVQLYTVSSHKVHGPKGVGALYIQKGTRILPLLFGGGQQQGLRPGTENAEGIAGFGAAVAAVAWRQEAAAQAAAVKAKLAEAAVILPEVYINGTPDGSPFILNMSFVGVRAEVLLHALEDKGIIVSAGAACAARRQKHTPMAALGLPAERLDSALRFSFSQENTVVEAAYCLGVLGELVPMLRRYRRAGADQGKAGRKR